MAWHPAFGGRGGDILAAASGYEFTNSEAETVVDAMTTEPDDTRKAVIDTLVGDLKTAGVWSKLDILYVMAAHAAQAAKINWKSPGGAFDLSAINSPTFDADVGYAGDGSSAYLQTFWDADTNGSQYAQNDAHIGVWLTNHEPGTTSRCIGTDGVDSDNFSLTVNTIDWLSVGANETGSTPSWTSEADGAPGHLVGVVADSTVANMIAYKNGASLGNPDANTTGSTSGLSSDDVHLLRNSSSYAASTTTIGAAHWGAELTASEVSDLYDALDAYMKAINADAEAQAVVAGMTTAPSDARRDAIYDLVRDLKACTAWYKMDLLYVTAAHAEDAALVNWRDPGTFDLTLNSDMAFTEDTGLIGASGDFAGTGYIPSTHADQLTQDAFHFGIGATIPSASGNRMLFGSVSGSTPDLHMWDSSTDHSSGVDFRGRSNDSSGLVLRWQTAGDVVGGSRAHYCIVHDGTNDGDDLLYTDGASRGAPDAVGGGTASDGLPTTEMAIGKVDSATCTVSVEFHYAHLGAVLTAAEVSASDSAFDTYMAAL